MGTFLEEHLPEGLSFHSVAHTREVVAAARHIGSKSRLTANELEIVQVAAWFHDTGYCCRYFGHEANSLEIAREFLSRQDYPEEKIAAVISCISATRWPQNPLNLPDMVLCDADLFHFPKLTTPNTPGRFAKNGKPSLKRPIPTRNGTRRTSKCSPATTTLPAMVKMYCRHSMSAMWRLSSPGYFKPVAERKNPELTGLK